jgi:hypothetical protein
VKVITKTAAAKKTIGAPPANAPVTSTQSNFTSEADKLTVIVTQAKDCDIM